MEHTPSTKGLHPSHLSTELGRRIVDLRQKTGLRQNLLASRAGLRSQRLSNIERGIHSPRIDEVAALSGALGVSLDELVFGGPQPVADRRAREKSPAGKGAPTAEEIHGTINRVMESLRELLYLIVRLTRFGVPQGETEG